MRPIIGLDLQGTRLGWAILVGEELMEAGVYTNLGARQVPGARPGTTRREVFKGLAMEDLRNYVRELLARAARYRLDSEIAFEDVMNHGAGQVLSAHAWGAAERAVLEVVDKINFDRLLHGDRDLLVVHRIGVAQAKLALAGSGKARKPDMVAAARRKWPTVEVDWDAADGDAADAAGVALSVRFPGETVVARAKREAAERRAQKAAKRSGKCPSA